MRWSHKGGPRRGPRATRPGALDHQSGVDPDRGLAWCQAIAVLLAAGVLRQDPGDPRHSSSCASPPARALPCRPTPEPRAASDLACEPTGKVAVPVHPDMPHCARVTRPVEEIDRRQMRHICVHRVSLTLRGMT